MPQPEGRLPQVVKKKEGHMPELRKRRSHLALLGVFAMAASVLAVGAPSATAEQGKADAAAMYSACVGPATVDAGFTDVATGSTHDAAINCIAYYGITRGTTATTFSPNLTITRWQLAVMLQRAAGPADVTLPEAEAQGFTDISGMSSAFQDAINQMAALGVMTGTTATTFDPSGIVSRAVIVEALAGFLTNARVGPGGASLSRDANRVLTLKEDASAGAMTVTPDESFRDIYAVNYAANEAIRALAEMGVVQGRGDGTFGPAASVTRAQAAAFITRALAHTNARPAGLTMQVENTAVSTETDFELSISLRGSDFAPIDSAMVDVFSHTSRNAATAFKSDGTCNSGASGVQATGGGVGVCAIELDDEVTEPDGNVSVTPGRISEATTYWAWSGDTGARLDWDVTESVSMDNSDVSNAASVNMTTVTAPAKAKVSTSVSSDAENDNTVRYGTTVTVTIQLVDAQDKPIGVAGQAYTWWAQGVHDPASSQIPSTGSRVVSTDSDGKATFTLTQSDPDTSRNAATNNNKTTWTYNIRAVPSTRDGVPSPPDVDANAMIGFTVASGVGTGSVVFDDDDGRALAVTIELGRPWSMVPASGQSARVGVTGKVTDQYGRPLRGIPLFFDVDGNDRFGCDEAAPTECATAGTDIGANGEIRETFRRVTRSNGTNTITAAYDGGLRPVYRVAANLSTEEGDTDVADDGEQAEATHYWVQPPYQFNAETGSAPDPGGALFVNPLLYADLGRNTLVMDNPWYRCDADPTDGCDTPYTTDAAGYNITPNRPRLPRAYTYTDTTLFRWYVRDADSDDRWLSTTEFESRMARLLATPNDPPYGPANAPVWVGARQYNTKSGFTVLEIRLNRGLDIMDPTP